MKLRFFHVSAVDPDPDALDGFLAGHRVLAVDTEFVADGPASFWAVCVRYVDGPAPPGKVTRRPPVDYRELLDPEAFTVYARLRELRNRLAKEEGRPSYAIFTNEQLAKMAELPEPSREALAAIDGVGPARLESYADAFLEALRQARGQD